MPLLLIVMVSAALCPAVTSRLPKSRFVPGAACPELSGVPSLTLILGTEVLTGVKVIDWSCGQVVIEPFAATYPLISPLKTSCAVVPVGPAMQTVLA